jgi:hypothetical protein
MLHFHDLGETHSLDIPSQAQAQCENDAQNWHGFSESDLTCQVKRLRERCTSQGIAEMKVCRSHQLLNAGRDAGSANCDDAGIRHVEELWGEIVAHAHQASFYVISFGAS